MLGKEKLGQQHRKQTMPQKLEEAALSSSLFGKSSIFSQTATTNSGVKDIPESKDSTQIKDATLLNEALHAEINSVTPRARKIKFLLTEGADINFQSEEDGYTALMLAVDSQNDRIAEYLLKQGANPLLCNVNGEIASNLAFSNSSIFSILKGYELLCATDSNDIPTVETLLLSGVYIEFRGVGGYTPLLIAAENNSFDLVQFLLTCGADLNAKRIDGLNAVDLASDEKILDLLKSADKMTGSEIEPKDEPLEFEQRNFGESGRSFFSTSGHNL